MHKIRLLMHMHPSAYHLHLKVHLLARTFIPGFLLTISQASLLLERVSSSFLQASQSSIHWHLDLTWPFPMSDDWLHSPLLQEPLDAFPQWSGCPDPFEVIEFIALLTNQKSCLFELDSNQACSRIDH